jgi:hypothetical protein
MDRDPIHSDSLTDEGDTPQQGGVEVGSGEEYAARRAYGSEQGLAGS